MNRRPTFKPDYEIDPPIVRRASAGYWLVKWLVIIVAAVACVFGIVS